jgi:hypothetical protein
MKQEMQDTKWFISSIALMLAISFLAGFIAYRLAILIRL